MKGHSSLIAAGTLAAILFGTASFGAEESERPDAPQARVVVCPTALFATQEPVVGAREAPRPPVQERSEVDVETPLGQVRAVLRILEELKEGRRGDVERFSALLAALEAHDARVQERFDALGEGGGVDSGEVAPASLAEGETSAASVPTSEAIAAAARREAARWGRRWATRGLVGFAIFILARNCVETLRRRRDGAGQAG